MRIAISGSSGLIGSAVIRALRDDGNAVIRIVRPHVDPNVGDVRWDPVAGYIDLAALDGVDAVIHLAAEPINAYVWTRGKRARIRNSRVIGTSTLAHGLTLLKRKPEVFVSVSGVAYYGDRGNEWLDEGSSAGTGFLAQTAVDWEAAARPAAEAGIRVVLPRLAPVVDRRSPFVARLRPLVSYGLGAWFGSGKQFWPWIDLGDVVGICRFLLQTGDVHGPLVAVAPEPITNRKFVKTMGAVLHRPVLFGIPAPLLRVVLGNLARDMLLSSQRTIPRYLLDAGYKYFQPKLESALRVALSM